MLSAIYGAIFEPDPRGGDILGRVEHAIEQHYGHAADDHSLDDVSAEPVPGLSDLLLDQDVADLLISHVRRARQLRQQLESRQREQTALSRLLDCWPVGAMLVDGSAQPKVMSRHARRIVGLRDGLYLQHGRLVAATPTKTASLRAMIATAVECAAGSATEGSHALSLDRPSGERPYSVFVQSLGRDSADIRSIEPMAILLVGSTAAIVQIQEHLLQALYGLTPTEARLAAEIGCGQPLEAVSEKLGITVGTARIHLKHVFSKTATCRQAELVHLLLSGPGLICGH